MRTDSRGCAVADDLKPANIMVGRFGEVVLMDWGISRLLPKGNPPLDANGQPPKGEFIGTPAYMSPEQASGLVLAFNPRSDIYSATVLFHELLTLRHYLAAWETLPDILVGIAREQFPYSRLGNLRHPGHPCPPAELLHFLARGLEKNPDQRFQSMDQMLDELQAMREGRMRIQCPATLARRMTSEVSRFLARSPVASMVTFYAVLLVMLSCVGVTLRVLIGH